MLIKDMNAMRTKSAMLTLFKYLNAKPVAIESKMIRVIPYEITILICCVDVFHFFNETVIPNKETKITLEPEIHRIQRG